MKRIIMRWQQWYNLLDGYRDEGEWFGTWENEPAGLKGGFLRTLGDLVGRELYYGTCNGDASPLVAVREQMLRLFPQANQPTWNDEYIGAYVYEHAAELGLEIVCRNEYHAREPIYPSAETLNRFRVDEDHPRPSHDDEVINRVGPWKTSSSQCTVYLATSSPASLNPDLTVVEENGRPVVVLGPGMTDLAGDGRELTSLVYRGSPLGLAPNEIDEIKFSGGLAWRNPNYKLA